MTDIAPELVERMAALIREMAKSGFMCPGADPDEAAKIAALLPVPKADEQR